MSIFNEGQQSFVSKIEAETSISNWEDWRWQLKHSINSIDKLLSDQYDTISLIPCDSKRCSKRK